MTTPTAKSRTSRRKPPEPATAQLLTAAQIDQLLEMQQKLGESLDQATAALEKQQQQIRNLVEMVDNGNALRRRFARHLLGVPAGASPAEIRRAYRGKAKALHPDTGGDAEAFDLLQMALELLAEAQP